MTLWLARHARPLIAPGVCYGALDVPSDAQASRVAAQALALELPPHLSVVVSPRKRCVQLAGELQHLRPDLLWSRDDRLQEMDFGQWEGQAWEQIPRAALDAWTADFGDHRFGGVQSANEFLQRVAQVWDLWRATGKPALWITHAGVIRAVNLLAQGHRRIARADQWPASAPAFGAWQTLEHPAP